ncbi:STN domain-containing protein [Bradyrhizobium cenepequi]|uniref:STN domain-containing protein n=1 Tax=Bradyrhizobium cenepequi TaxID=2821403 RepID=UPI001CE2CCA5|nr:STN domain-containing protein [Bradyrhizobium cenepequi]
MTFNIPAQPLIDALQAYSQQAGVQVMFETTSAADLRSQSVNGEYTPQAALLMLLADTDLRVRYSRTNAVTLAPASAPDPDEPPIHPPGSADITLGTLRVRGTSDASDRNLGEYIGLVQSDIQKALKGGRNRRGEYRVGVKLWVTPSSRTVDRAELDGSTGDVDRDSSITEALRGLVLSQQAPPNMPLPIRFMISIHAL